MTMEKSSAAHPVTKYACEGKPIVAPTDACSTEAGLNTTAAHSMTAATLAANEATTRPPLAVAAAAELKATARQQVQLLETKLGAEEESTPAAAQENLRLLRQQRQVELLQRQEELGRRLLVLQEQQRQRDEAAYVGVDEWRWVTSTASDAASEEEAEYSGSNAYTSAASSNNSCCASGLKESFKEERQPGASVVAGLEYASRISSFSNAAVVQISSHNAAAVGEKRGSVLLRFEEPQSETQVYSDFAPSRAGSAAAVYAATVGDTNVAGAAAAPVSDGSSGLSFPHLLWQEDEAVEAGGEVRAEFESLHENERADSAAIGPPLERAPAAAAAVPSQRRISVMQQQQRIRYPFPEAAVLWESSSSCCSDEARVTSVVDEEQRQQQLMPQQDRRQQQGRRQQHNWLQQQYRRQQHSLQQQNWLQQQDWQQQQKAQLQSLLGSAGSAAALAFNEWRDDAATALAQSGSSSFSFQDKTCSEPAASRDCDREESITRPGAAPVAECVDVACITVGCRRTCIDASAEEKKKKNAGDKVSGELTTVATPIDEGSSAAVADPGTAEVSTATASSFSSTPVVSASNEKRCVAGEDGTADAVPNSRSSPVICGAAEHISTQKISKLLQGRCVMPLRAAAASGEAAERRGHLLVQPPTRPTSSPRTIVPLHRHWVQQLLLQQRKQQQRVQRLQQQQQQRLRQQRGSQSVQAQQQHVKKKQQQVQQHGAREQQHQQPRRRDRMLPQVKVSNQRGESGHSLTQKTPSKGKSLFVPPADESKLFRGRGKTSITGVGPSEAAAASCAHDTRDGDTHKPATSNSLTPFALPTNDSIAAELTAAPATARNSAATLPGSLVALSLATRNTAAGTAPPAAVAPAVIAGTSLPVWASAASDGLACPARLPVAAADGAGAPPPSDMMKSRLGCRDVSFAFAAMADVLSRNAAADSFLRPAAPEVQCSPMPAFLAASATAPRSSSRTPPLSRSSVRNQYPLSTTNGSLRQAHAGTPAAAATTISHNEQQWHLLDESLRLLSAPHVLPPAGTAGAAFGARDVVARGATADLTRLPASAAACMSSTGVVATPVNTATERKDKTKNLLDSQTFKISNLNSSFLSLKDSGVELKQPVAIRRRSNIAAATAAAGAAQQSTDLRRKHASAAAPGRTAASVTAASAAAAVAAVPSRDKGLAVSAPAGGNRGRTETSNRKSSKTNARNFFTSNDRSTVCHIRGGEGQLIRRTSLSIQMAGEGGNHTNQKGEATSAAQSAQRRGTSVGEQQQQQQGGVQQDQQGEGELVVRGLQVTKQKTGSAEEMQQQQCVMSQVGIAKESEKAEGEQEPQQQLFEDNEGDEVLKIQGTLEKLRKRLVLDTSETDSQFKVQQQGKHAIICFPGSSSHHDKSSSNRQLQQQCSRRNSHCGTASRKMPNAEPKGDLSRGSNSLSRSAVYSRNGRKATASIYKENRDMRETMAAASKEKRSVITGGRTSLERDPPVGSTAGTAKTARKLLKGKTSPAAASKNRLQQLLTTSSESNAGLQTDGHCLNQQQEQQLQLRRQGKSKEEVKREESGFSHWMTHAQFRGAGRDAGLSVNTESVEGAIRECSTSGSSRHSSRSRQSSNSSMSCTPSTILRRLRRLLQKDSSSACVSPEYHMHRLNGGRKNQRQKGWTHSESRRGGSKSSAGDQSSKRTKSRSVRIRRKADHSSSTWRGRSSNTRRLNSTSSSDTTSCRRGSSRGSRWYRETTLGSRRMWEKLVTQSRRRLRAGSSKASSSGYDMSVSGSRRYRRRRRTSNTISRMEMSGCSEPSSSSEVSGSSSEVSSNNEASSISSRNSEASSVSSSEVSGSSKVFSSILRQTNAEESEYGFLEPLKKRWRQMTKKRNASAAQSYLADVVDAAASPVGHRSHSAAGGGAAETAGSSLAAVAADAPGATRHPRKEKEPPPSLISLWLQYSAAALEDTQLLQRLLLPSAETFQQQLEGRLQSSDTLLQQEVKTNSSSPPRRRESCKDRTHSREDRSSSSGSSRSRSHGSALQQRSSSSEGSNSDNSSISETPHLPHCRPSDEDSSLCLDPNVIIRRIKRRLRLPLRPRLKDRTQRRQRRDCSETSINNSNSVSPDKSKKKLWAHAEQPRQLPQPQPRPRQRQEEQQHKKKEPEQQHAQDIPETFEDESVGALERKEDAVDREQHKSEDVSGRRFDHNQERIPEGYPVAPLQQEQGQRCIEATGEGRQTDSSIAGDDPSGPLRLSALGSPISPPHRLREEKHPQQPQQEQEEDKKQATVLCEKQKQRLQASKQQRDQQEHEPQELQRLILTQDGKWNTLFCPTAATADEGATSDLKEATTLAGGAKLNSSLSAVASAEIKPPVSPTVIEREEASPRAVSTVAQAAELSLNEDRRAAAAAADVLFLGTRGKEQGHRDGKNKWIFAFDASHADRRPSGHQPHLKTEQQQEKHAPEAQTKMQQQKVHQKQKSEEMHQQQVQQSVQRQERKQQASPAVAIEKMIDKKEKSLNPSQCEVVSKLQALPNGSSHGDFASEQQQPLPINEKAPPVAGVPAAAAVVSSDPAARMHAASALPAAAAGALSGTAPRVFGGGNSSPDAATAVVTADFQTSTLPSVPLEAALEMNLEDCMQRQQDTVTAAEDAAVGESRAVAHPVVIAKAGYPDTMIPAAAAAATDEAEVRAAGDAFCNDDAYPTPVQRAAMLNSSKGEQRATVAAAGGGLARPLAAVAAATDLAKVRYASSVGTFSFSLSSSSGTSNAADYMSSKLKQSSNSSSLDKSNGSSRIIDIDTANNVCFPNDADTNRLDGNEREHWRNVTYISPTREKHSNPCANPAAQLTAPGGLLGLTSANDGGAIAGTADAAGAAEGKKAVTSVGIPAAARICEGPCTSMVAEIDNGSSNDVTPKDTKAVVVATPAKPSSARNEETESGHHVLQRGCYIDARESTSSAARMQQPPELFQSTYTNPRKERDTACREDKSLSTKKGEAERNFRAACAAAATSGVSGGVAVATPAVIRASCPAAQGGPRAAGSCPNEETVKAHAVGSLVEGTATSAVKKQQPQQPDAFVPHEMVLTREAPPPEVLDLLMQQQRLLQNSTKHFRLPANTVSCDSCSSIAEDKSWWLSLLSGTEILTPDGAQNTQQEEVPEQHFKQQTFHQEQQKQNCSTRRRKNDLQPKQQQTLRHGRSGGAATADDRAALEASEEGKSHGHFERQVVSVVLGRNNQAEKVFASCDESGEHGSDICAVMSSNSAVIADKGVAILDRPYHATQAGSRVYVKDPERVDIVAIAEAPTDVLPDAVLASTAPIFRAACWKEEEFVVAALTELQQFLRKREEFSRCGGTDVLLQPFGHTSSSYLKEAQRNSAQEQSLAKACGDTNLKKSNVHSPAGGGTRNSRVPIDPAEESEAREKSQLSKNISLGECGFATAAVTQRKKGKGAAPRCRCLKGIRRATATIVKADGEEMQTSIIRRRAHRETAGCSCCNPSQTEGHSPVAAAEGDATKRQKRVGQHASNVLRGTSCRHWSSRLDRGCHSRQLSHSSVNTDDTKSMQESTSKSNTSQRNSSNNTERSDNRNICHERRSSETWPRYGCSGTTTEPGGRSRKMRKGKRRCCFRSRDVTGCESGDCRGRAHETSETSSDSTSSGGSRSCCCSSEEHIVEERGSALKQQRRAHRGTLNKDNSENRNVPRLQPQHCRGRHIQQCEYHRQQRQRGNSQVDTDVGEARAHRSEKHFNVVARRRIRQCCTHGLLSQQRHMAWSCMRRPSDTSLDHSVHQQTTGSVSVSPFFEGRKTRNFLPPREQLPQFSQSFPQEKQELLQGVKQETAQPPLRQVEIILKEQPDIAWCWREWGGCEIYKQQRNRLQAVLRETLEGFA